MSFINGALIVFDVPDFVESETASLDSAPRATNGRCPGPGALIYAGRGLATRARSSR